MIHQICLFVASAMMRRYLKLWPPWNTHGMTCTIAHSSSQNSLCRSLTSFPWRPNISSMGRLTGSRTQSQHPMPSKKRTWWTFFQPLKLTSQPTLRSLKKSCWGHLAPPEEVNAYTALFQEFRDIFGWSYTKMPGLDPFIMEHHIDTWPDVAPIRLIRRIIHL